MDMASAPSSRDTATESHFQDRLEQQGWRRFDAQNASTVARESWRALQHIYGAGVMETPLRRSAELEAEAAGGARVHLKLDLLQTPGSFKIRGATHALATLAAQGHRLVYAASTGNHALSVAHAAGQLRREDGSLPVRAVLYLPSTVDPGKAERLRRQEGVEVRIAGTDCVETERVARAAAEEAGVPYLSPYNDPLVVAGQGTLAFELLMALPKLDLVFVPVGGGGLISGIASVLKSIKPGVRVVGCQPAGSAVMAASVEAGRLLQDVVSEDTLSGATAGGVEEGSITWDLCRDLVDDWVRVSEREIAAAMLDLAKWQGVRVEGASAVAAAGMLRWGPQLRGQSVVVVLSGGNVSDEVLAEAHALAADRRSAAAAAT